PTERRLDLTRRNGHVLARPNPRSDDVTHAVLLKRPDHRVKSLPVAEHLQNAGQQRLRRGCRLRRLTAGERFHDVCEIHSEPSSRVRSRRILNLASASLGTAADYLCQRYFGPLLTIHSPEEWLIFSPGSMSHNRQRGGSPKVLQELMSPDSR